MDNGVTKEQRGELFKEISESNNFWMKLAPLPEGQALMELMRGMETAHQLYFVTDRAGKTAKFQTEAWLLKWFELPTVLISGAKGPIAKALKLDLYVDDKAENCTSVVEETGGNTVVIMPNRGYNVNVVTHPKVLRVGSLIKALSGPLGLRHYTIQDTLRPLPQMEV